MAEVGPDKQLLAAALLWLRNHYDVGESVPVAKNEILERVDRILHDCDVTFTDLERFRKTYPRNR